MRFLRTIQIVIDYIDDNVKVRDHFHTSKYRKNIGKNRGSVPKDCNINVKLNKKNIKS